jgi:aspartate racemase
LKNRIIGILGGMGPEATVDFYREIIRLTPAKRDQEHLQVLIYSNPTIPDRTRAILEGTDDPLPALIQSARILETAGAGILAIPCNTAHYFYARLQANLRIPVLHMIDQTLLYLREHYPEAGSVGLLASQGTVLSGIYASVFGREGIEVLTSDALEQQRVHAAIEDIKAGVPPTQVRAIFDSAVQSLLHRGARAIILGCTEIPLAFHLDPPSYPCLNPTKLLAQAAVDWALAGGNPNHE